ncbi:MAG TPA: alpha-amylase family glycosyl hydrolase [Chthoniobacteraceae bacterium]|nr:alpha-amylase family glycosyl hydrolase [Chthoniobacteraceae bacterium]
MPASTGERGRIYQLFVRLFSNTNETRKPNGTLAENGAGKFNGINSAALASLKEMGFTHVWLTGVLRQASATAYPSAGLAADDADLLKGLAGSPYAIRDYFDVCPDYADNPAERLAEFRALIARIHDTGLKVLIDIAANHVARSYRSVVRPDLDFGTADDKTKFCDPKNNFYYLAPGLGGPPLRLPTVKDGAPVSPTCKVAGMKCDGLFDGETTFGRVTGNNAATWTPSINDWYETVKLNYGWDFIAGRRHYPSAENPSLPIPDTWLKMDAIVAYWQSLGVDGFRCDMAHMVPVEFWKWLIATARTRAPGACFIAEAYDNDPAKIPGPGGNNVLLDLLEAGFDAVYDDPSYKILKRIYDGPSWANDLDAAASNATIFHGSLRYAENHDEVRLASRGNWADIGMEAGRAVCGVLYGMSRGPVMFYNGQEAGEPGDAPAGFGGGNARTTIFDYWSMVELPKWVNGLLYDGARLSDTQKNLRAFYKALLNLIGEPAFRDGEFYPVNPANNGNPQFGRVDGEPAGGHWMYAYARRDSASGQRFLVVANLHREITFQNVPVFIPAAALGMASTPDQFAKRTLLFTERLENKVTLRLDAGDFSSTYRLEIPAIPPLTPFYFEVKPAV